MGMAAAGTATQHQLIPLMILHNDNSRSIDLTISWQYAAVINNVKYMYKILPSLE
jgi:hypothetical protein